MGINIYNSLTRKKEEFIPRIGQEVRLYSCGVTVYDKCHIGHARSLYVVEVIRRYLRYRGFRVHFVRNITDVDDKIIKKAQETNRTFEQVVAENIGFYERDLEILEIPRADQEPRATENIDIMVAHIEGLIAKGFAYAVNGDVYFRVRRFSEYGKLSGQGIEKMMEAVRIEKDEKKEDPLDFALWKKSKEGEPSWPSPWGLGRPGWHIECSCMSMKHLSTETLDIHTGGQDLIFPHHENEIAQSEALTGKPFARYWVHNGLLTINGQKMAKSLGNFITVADALTKYTADDLKLFFLTSHYSSAIDFNQDRMVESHKEWQKFDVFLRKAKDDRKAGKELLSSESQYWTSYRNDFFAAMDDDFNTPKALSVLFELMSETYRREGKEGPAGVFWQAGDFVLRILQEIFGLFGGDSINKISPELRSEIEHLVKEREQARKSKDFRRSDEIRDILKQKGFIIEDTKDGQKWRMA
jgi:cysteinyl-tRNA synthetase